jgi:hypothetical protein
VSDLATYSITGLPKGSSTIYGCAVDADGAHFCTSGDVVVKDPPANFSAAAALDSVDVTQAASTGDVAALTKIAMSVSNLAAYVTASSVSLAQTLTSTTAAAAQAKVDAKAASIITSLAAKVDARDYQAMQTVVTAVVSLGKASANMSAATKASVLSVTSAGKSVLQHFDSIQHFNSLIFHSHDHHTEAVALSVIECAGSQLPKRCLSSEACSA